MDGACVTAHLVVAAHVATTPGSVAAPALDLSAIYADYTEVRGYPPYDPRLMLRLLIYGYATGVPSQTFDYTA